MGCPSARTRGCGRALGRWRLLPGVVPGGRTGPAVDRHHAHPADFAVARARSAFDRRPAERSPAWRPTAGGSTPGSTTSTARSSPASTAGPSPPARSSESTLPPSSSASSPNGSTTGDGTARPRTVRSAPPSTRRSTCSTDWSSSSGRPADRPRWPRPAAAVRSTCSSAACSAARAPARSSIRRISSSHSRTTGTTTCSVLSTTSASREHRPIRAWPRRWTVVRSKQQPDGRWLLDRVHPGRVHFELEDGVGLPSRSITLRAVRVLDWWGSTS